MDILHLRAGMQSACEEAAHWIGATSPNPPVGAAALDEKGRLLATAAHVRAGEDHAEVALLKLLHKRKLMGRLHTMCVTLEPCNHHGRTPPCSEAIIDAGVKCVAFGVRDPNPHVEGGGREKLRAAGLEVVEGVERDACLKLMHAFIYNARTGRPFITVKRAFALDGSMFPPPGQKTFTSDASLRLAHRLRKKADAILTGAGTVLADDPMFTVRRVSDYREKVRTLAIMDRDRQVPETYLRDAIGRRQEPALYTDLETCFSDLERRGIIDILVESGPTLSESIIESGFWTMMVDIYKRGGSKNDLVKVSFNPASPPPFDSEGFDLETILPK